MGSRPLRSLFRCSAPGALLLVLACGARTGELGADPEALGTGGAEFGGGHFGGAPGGRQAGGSANAPAGAPAHGGAPSSAGASSSGGHSGGGGSGGMSASGGAANRAGSGGAVAAAGASGAAQGGTGGTGGTSGSAGTGGSAGSNDDCCTAHAAASCSRPAIALCVCEGQGMFGGDSFCCSNQWDQQCTEEVARFACGSCPRTP